MTVSALSKDQLDALSSAFEKFAPAGGPVAADFSIDGVQTEFCDIWPKAEPILKIVAKFIGYIPGVGSAAGVIINGLIAGGDALAGAVCPKSGK